MHRDVLCISTVGLLCNMLLSFLSLYPQLSIFDTEDSRAPCQFIIVMRAIDLSSQA